MLLRRALVEDTLPGGYKVERGQDVMISVYNIHHSPAVWDDPEAFKPERFPLDQPAPNEQNTDFRYMPLSGGPRKCEPLPAWMCGCQGFELSAGSCGASYYRDRLAILQGRVCCAGPAAGQRAGGLLLTQHLMCPRCRRVQRNCHFNATVDQPAASKQT